MHTEDYIHRNNTKLWTSWSLKGGNFFSSSLPTSVGSQKSLDGSDKDSLGHYSHLEMSHWNQHPKFGAQPLPFLQQKSLKSSASFFVQ